MKTNINFIFLLDFHSFHFQFFYNDFKLSKNVIPDSDQIIWVSNLINYCKVCYEDDVTNRLKEDMPLQH